MRIFGGKRLDKLFEQPRAAGDTGAEAIAERDQLVDKGVGVRGLAVMQRPAVLKQRAEMSIGIGNDDVARNHLVVLSIEAHAKPSGPLAESGFATFQNVTDSLADCCVLQSSRDIADRRQTV